MLKRQVLDSGSCFKIIINLALFYLSELTCPEQNILGHISYVFCKINYMLKAASAYSVWEDFPLPFQIFKRGVKLS